MLSWGKKRGQAPIDTTVALVLLAAAVVTIILILLLLQGYFTADFVQNAACWGTNTIKCGGGAFYNFPSACRFNYIEVSVGIEDLSNLLRETWWMYKQGECNFGMSLDETMPVAFAFVPEEDIDLNEFFAFLVSHNRGRETDGIHSDYNYFEQNTHYQTLCFDTNDPYIRSQRLKKDQPYYIIFFDDQDWLGDSSGDRILISPDPDFYGLNADNFFVKSFEGAGFILEYAQFGIVGEISSYAGGPLGRVAYIIGGKVISSLQTGQGATIVLEKFADEDSYRGCLPYGPKLPS